MAPASVSAEERIFSLILALVAAPNGLTRDELLSSVHGYSRDYTHRVANPSLERKFERDKADLRELGIPLEVIDSPLEPGNNQLARYRIQKSLLEVPSGMRFTAEELALLQAAALTWSEGSVSEDSRRALLKLQSFASGIDTSLIGVAPHMPLTEPAEHALRSAIRADRVVRFSYRKPLEATAQMRTVSPLRLHRADGRWHLIGFDHDRDSYRVFLLSRISGRVTDQGQSVDPEHLQGIDGVIAQLADVKASQVARLWVAPGSRAEARLRPRAIRVDPATSELEISTLDYDALASELLAFEADVRILDPQELADRRTALLTKLALMHAPNQSRETST